MKKFRVLFVFNRFYPAISGAEVHMHEIAKSLVERGHRVDVFTLNVLNNEDYIGSACPLKAEENVNGINVRRFPVTNMPLHNRLMYLLEKKGIQPYISGYRRVFSFKLISALKNIDYDCVITGVMPYAGIIYPALHAARKKNIKSIIIPLIHFGVPHDNRYEYEYFSSQCLNLYRMADSVIVNTKAESDFLRNKKYLGNIFRINPIIDDYKSEKKKSSKKFNVCTLGFGNYEKGIDSALEGFRKFAINKKNVMLNVAGSINNKYKRIIENYDNAVYLGLLNNEEKRKFFSECDVYLQPSMAESFGIATLEAQSAGIPTINAFCSGSMKIINDRENGFLVPFGDTGMIRDYLESLYNNEALRESIGENAIVNARKYDRNNHLEGMNLLEEYLCGNSRM